MVRPLCRLGAAPTEQDGLGHPARRRWDLIDTGTLHAGAAAALVTAAKLGGARGSPGRERTRTLGCPDGGVVFSTNSE